MLNKPDNIWQNAIYLRQFATVLYKCLFNVITLHQKVVPSDDALQQSQSAVQTSMLMTKTCGLNKPVNIAMQ